MIKKILSIINGDRRTGKLIKVAKERHDFEVLIGPIMLKCCADVMVEMCWLAILGIIERAPCKQVIAGR